MSLRTRLLIGYGYLVLLIVLAAGGAAIGFFDLSRGIDRILQENVRSLTAATDMLEALERQDSATLAALVQPGVGPEIRQGLDHADIAFAESLADAKGNLTVEGEEKLLAQIEQEYNRYTELREALLARRLESPLAAYNEETFALFVHVKQSVLDLIEMNRLAMVEADRQARQTAMQNGVWLGVLVALALLSLIFLSRALRRVLISRLTSFEKVSEAIAAGDAKRRLEVGYKDELGSIARHFNAAIDAQEHLRQEAQGQAEPAAPTAHRCAGVRPQAGGAGRPRRQRRGDHHAEVPARPGDRAANVGAVDGARFVEGVPAGRRAAHENERRGELSVDGGGGETPGWVVCDGRLIEFERMWLLRPAI